MCACMQTELQTSNKPKTHMTKKNTPCATQKFPGARAKRLQPSCWHLRLLRMFWEPLIMRRTWFQAWRSTNKRATRTRLFYWTILDFTTTTVPPQYPSPTMERTA